MSIIFYLKYNVINLKHSEKYNLKSGLLISNMELFNYNYYENIRSLKEPSSIFPTLNNSCNCLVLQLILVNFNFLHSFFV